MSLIDVHGRVGNAAMLFMLILALWALLTWLRRERLSAGFWGALVIGEGLMVVQGLLGVILLLGGAVPSQSLHLLYGGTTVVAIPAAYAYIRTGVRRREALLYGLAVLFIFGLTVRAITTG